MSLTRTATLRPGSRVSRMCLSSVVLPLPKKPESKVTGTGSLDDGMMTLDEATDACPEPQKHSARFQCNLCKRFLAPSSLTIICQKPVKVLNFVPQGSSKMEMLWKFFGLALVIGPSTFSKHDVDNRRRTISSIFIPEGILNQGSFYAISLLGIRFDSIHDGIELISWIRHRDTHLLSVGRYTYTTDFRFSAQHLPMTHYWQLRIMNVSYEDEGYYECQLSTTPIKAHVVDLRVVEPHTEILGGPDMHVDRGSTINLTCIAKFSPAPPPDVEWLHNGQVISYDSARGGVSVVTEKGESTSSHLLIQRATPKDSGVYKCVPENTVEAAITLHIIKGKNPDAWQTSSAQSVIHPGSPTALQRRSWPSWDHVAPLLILEFLVERLVGLMS
eukprot:maker-scaffold30_size591359-snap-gene-1.20 protein:Tk12754 transcript:maker-scaffold30_size591359-snap-gene-1.20-mRNA-1 annotation:"protein amalgam"